MASVFLQIKDSITAKITPDCLKASADEVKSFAKEKKAQFGGGGGDPQAEAEKAKSGKITEWEAGFNVTNAIQVLFISTHVFSRISSHTIFSQ